MKPTPSQLFILVIIFSWIPINQVFSQEIHGDPDVWFLQLTNYQLSEKWSVGNELHQRFTNYLGSREQLLIRPFVNYHFNAAVTATFGYTYIHTWPYGDYPLPIEKPENNIWEQINLRHDVNRWVIQHRYRLEHRWQGDIINQTDGSFAVDGYSFSQRFRYRLTATYPINEKSFINLFDELWVRNASDIHTIVYDRNWLYLGLGYHLSSAVSAQIAYLHQHIQNNPTRTERHPGIQMTLQVNLK